MKETLISQRAVQGRWQRLHPAVYRIEAAPITWRQELAAALLWAGPNSVISHRAAAALHGLARFPQGRADVLVTKGLKHRAGVHVHRTTHLNSSEVKHLDNLSVTSIERTLIDLAAQEPTSTVRASVDEALRRKLTSVRRLKEAVDGAPHRRGIVALRAYITELDGGGPLTESELEARMRDVLEGAGVENAVLQQPVLAGGKLRRLDCRIAGTPVVIECDGYAYHSSPVAFERDRARGNDLAARGFIVLRWTWAQLNDTPQELVKGLNKVLERYRLSAR
jgi:very-short-patch-repair endonuclease